MVTPAARRAAARYLTETFGASERRACRVIGCPRTTLRRTLVRRADPQLLERLRSVAYERPRFGYRRVHVMLRREGFSSGLRHVRRLYKEEGLAVRRRKRKQRAVIIRRPRVSPMRPNERWSMDFVSDQVADGRRFRTFNVVDDFTRECLAIDVNPSMPAARVTRVLDDIVSQRGRPRSIVVDNGTEFTSVIFNQWAHRHGVDVQFIRPGKPVENAFAESFNGKFRDECLNQEWFTSMTHARGVIEIWRSDYNSVRPHSSLNDLPPSEFALRWASELCSGEAA
jgi:putative transposase